jgi:hypothetical protein
MSSRSSASRCRGKAKFRQGYYDVEVFERTDTGMDYLVAMQDSDEVRREYQDKGFRLPRFADVTSWYLGFNMLDPVVGWGDTRSSASATASCARRSRSPSTGRSTRRSSPRGGRGRMGPLPPGIFGSREGTAAGVQPGDAPLGRRQGRSAALDRRGEAADGRGRLPRRARRQDRQAAGHQLRLLRRAHAGEQGRDRLGGAQFAKLGIQLEVRATDNNQFQDKVRRASTRCSGWAGWPTTPTPRTSCSCSTAPTARRGTTARTPPTTPTPSSTGCSARCSCWSPTGRASRQLIDQHGGHRAAGRAVELRLLPVRVGAAQQWVHNYKPAVLIRDQGRYLRLDIAERLRKQAAWNRPVWWPLIVGAVLLAALVAFAWRSFRRAASSTRAARWLPDGRRLMDNA